MNSSERAAMGQLRSLLAQRPETSSQRRELISALDATLSLFSQELLRDVVIDYVLRALSQPPLDELRFSPPKSWLKALARGAPARAGDLPWLWRQRLKRAALIARLGPRSPEPP